MPTLRSSKKRLRQNRKRRMRNRDVKSGMRTVVKRALTAIEEDPSNAQKAVAAASSALDRAAKKGVIHSRQADRKKARLAARLKKALADKG